MANRFLKITPRAWKMLWRYRLRSGLLILMAALGVDGVVCSVNYGAGGTQQILDQIRRMGTNVLIITPAQSRAVAGRARTGGTVTTLVDTGDRKLLDQGRRSLEERHGCRRRTGLFRNQELASCGRRAF